MYKVIDQIYVCVFYKLPREILIMQDCFTIFICVVPSCPKTQVADQTYFPVFLKLSSGILLALNFGNCIRVIYCIYLGYFVRISCP